MSLETNLELNNQLLTRHNALLEQLIAAMSSGAAVSAVATTSVQEYREPMAETKAENTVIRKVTLDDLEFSDIIALAGFFPESTELTPEVIQRVVGYRDAEGNKRVVQIDALDSALRGVKPAKHLHNEVLLELARAIIKFWDELPTIADRRVYAEAWLDAKPDERDAVKPKKAGNKGKQERKGPFYWKSLDGSAIGEENDINSLNGLTTSGEAVEINKIEYLQLKKVIDAAGAATAEQPDFAALRKQAEGLILQLAKGGYRAEAVLILEDHGAKKLGEVADEKLAGLITAAEKALAGE